MKKWAKKMVFFCLLIAGAAMALTVSSWLFGGSSGPQYRTEKISRGTIAEVVTATGTLNPLQLVTVGTQVSGQISQLYVKVNDEVKKGQLLAEIDPSLLMTQLKQSQSNLETARINYEQAQRDMERNRMLLAKDYVAKMDLEHAEQAFASAKNNYDAAKTQVEHDQVNLNYAKIESPIDGIVISQDVTLGQTVAASFQTPTLFKIAGDLTKMKIDVSFSESDIGKIKEGLPVTFTVDAFPDHTFSGKVLSVNFNPNNTQGVVSYTAVVMAESSDKMLLPGMTAYVSVTLSEKKDVLRVPALALRFSPPTEQVSGLNRLLQPQAHRTTVSINDDDSKAIYVLRDGALVKVPVTTGATDEIYVEVSGKDIAEGDLVVTGIVPRY